MYFRILVFALNIYYSLNFTGKWLPHVIWLIWCRRDKDVNLRSAHNARCIHNSHFTVDQVHWALLETLRSTRVHHILCSSMLVTRMLRLWTWTFTLCQQQHLLQSEQYFQSGANVLVIKPRVDEQIRKDAENCEDIFWYLSRKFEVDWLCSNHYYNISCTSNGPS